MFIFWSFWTRLYATCISYWWTRTFFRTRATFTSCYTITSAWNSASIRTWSWTWWWWSISASCSPRAISISIKNLCISCPWFYTNSSTWYRRLIIVSFTSFSSWYYLFVFVNIILNKFSTFIVCIINNCLYWNILLIFITVNIFA